MHRTKSKPLKEQFQTLDEPVISGRPGAEAGAAEPVSGPSQFLGETEVTVVGWPAAEERRKRTMPITIQTVLLVLASLCFILAAFNTTVSPRVNLIGLGLFFWTLSLLIRV